MNYNSYVMYAKFLIPTSLSTWTLKNIIMMCVFIHQALNQNKPFWHAQNFLEIPEKGRRRRSCASACVVNKRYCLDSVIWKSSYSYPILLSSYICHGFFVYSPLHICIFDKKKSSLASMTFVLICLCFSLLFQNGHTWCSLGCFCCSPWSNYRLRSA